ncbi:MAG: TlpA disulfide reductase family protein [Bacteroidales bacterium]|jgi:peroxiredoxin|nr:TlpA disulfide reductase family protein [Bacteroidales bacterium]
MRFFITLLYYLGLSTLLFSQNSTITGKINNYTGNDSLNIVTFGTQKPIEQKVAVSSNGKFTYTYPSQGADFSKIYFTPKDFILIVLNSDETAKIEADYTNMSQTYTIKGAEDAELIQQNNQALLNYMHAMNELQESFKQKIDSIEQEKEQFIIQTIKDNVGSLSVLALIDLVDQKKYPEIYTLIDSALYKKYPKNSVVVNFHRNINQSNHLQQGTIIPNIELTDENGETVSLESFRGQTVLVVFWATWCRPCRMEIPHIKKAYEKYNDKGFTAFSVSTDKVKQKWLDFVQTEPVPWTTTHDGDGTYSNIFQVRSIPFTILIDAEGRIIAKNVRGEALKQYLEQIYAD